jgi:hypothetical protein
MIASAFLSTEAVAFWPFGLLDRAQHPQAFLDHKALDGALVAATL